MAAETKRRASPRRSAKTDVSHRVRDRLADTTGYMKEVGLPVPIWLGRLLFWWKQLGLKHALAVFSVFILPVINSQWTSRLADRLVATAAEYYGVDVSVGTWSGAWLGAHAVAHDVVVKVPGSWSKPEVFRADSVAIDLSILRRLRSGYWIKDVKIERPLLYLERTLSGRWNWEDVIGSPAARAEPLRNATVHAAAVSTPIGTPPPTRERTLRVEHLEMKDLRIEWMERIPANSGGGLIQNTTATLYLDDVQVSVKRLGATDGETPFSLDGRTADGLLSIAGRVAHGTAEPQAFVTVNLENVGAAAVGRLSPNTRLVPASGSVNGRVELVSVGSRVECHANLVLRNVTFVVNPYAELAPPLRDRLQQQLAALTLNGPADAPCSQVGSEPDYRVVPAIQTSVTRAAVRTAAPEIQAVADADVAAVQHKGPSADISAALQRDLARMAGTAIGGETGSAVARSLADSSGGKNGNAVTRSVKGVGRGIKRVFGGKGH